MTPNRKKPRILFIAEAVTLAHVVRPVVLAQSLDLDQYEVILACDDRYRHLFPDLELSQRSIQSISSERFLDNCDKGRPLFDADTLRAYVEEERQLFDEIEPDLVVGDLRLSLSVSARIAEVPYMAIHNAYWSPYARQRYPLPEIPLARICGVTMGSMIFRAVRPAAFACHSMPLNRVRREYGLPSLGYDLRRVYTDADCTLYTDIPELAPTYNLPSNHYYIGPVQWSPSVELPTWWDSVPEDKPIVYVNLGSSGQTDLLPVVLQGLVDMPLHLIVATAGRDTSDVAIGDAFVADYLPGEAACARAALVVCNGGSPTTYQALSQGKPVIGIPSNMDQYLNMQRVQAAGAGILLRAGTIKASDLRSSVERLHERQVYGRTASQLADAIAVYNSRSIFRSRVDHVLRDRLGVLPDKQELDDSHDRRSDAPVTVRAFPKTGCVGSATSHDAGFGMGFKLKPDLR